jgi:hypothetical protein
LPAMTCVSQAYNQSHDAVNWVGKSIQRVHVARLMMSIFRVKPMARANSTEDMNSYNSPTTHFYGKYFLPCFG